MVQEFQVLRCFSCQIFQVHQVSKSQKWACKLCGEKQSLLKVYGQGSGADCRHHVQKLNLLQGEVGQVASSTAGCQRSLCLNDSHARHMSSLPAWRQNWQNAISDGDQCDDTQGRPGASQEAISTSRWNKYLEENRDNGCKEEESPTDTDQEPLLSPEEISSTIRKRKKSSLYGCGLDDHDGKGVGANWSKKNKICEDWGVSTARASQSASRKTEDIGSLKCHGKPASHALPVVVQSCTESRWERFISSNEREEGERIASTASFQNPGIDFVLNKTSPSKKPGPGWLSADEQGNQHIGTNMLPALLYTVPVQEPFHPLADHQTSLLPKPLTLFHTDEDFDDNY